MKILNRDLAPVGWVEQPPDNSRYSQHPINGRVALPVSVDRSILLVHILYYITDVIHLFRSDEAVHPNSATNSWEEVIRKKLV